MYRKKLFPDFRSDMPTKELSKRVANYKHAYTLYSAVRPFGATIMLGSWTADHGSQVTVSLLDTPVKLFNRFPFMGEL